MSCSETAQNRDINKHWLLAAEKRPLFRGQTPGFLASLKIFWQENPAIVVTLKSRHNMTTKRFNLHVYMLEPYRIKQKRFP